MRGMLSEGNGGLQRVHLSSGASDAEIYLYGGHVTRFNRHGEPPVLFLSDQSFYKRGKAIRGGIPVIFPWFGAHPEDPTKPQHGFARTSEWKLVSSGEDEVVLRLEANEETRAAWPHDFVATLRVKTGERLTVALEVEARDAFTFEAALHTYLTVGDVASIHITGLNDAEYIDKTQHMMRKRQNGPVTIERETDSVYLNTTASCAVVDPVLDRTIIVDKSGSRSTVIWNPHEAKSKGFADFGDDEWKRMVCVETANAGENAVSLSAGQKAVMTAIVSVEPGT
jgi:glucose-6-phosphate 1-epimerase